MNSERWRLIESLFADAVECPLSERSRFLERACGNDGELRKEVESLLACDAPEQQLIELPAGLTLTRHEVRMLTPDYASPEKVKGLRISTASDTYSPGAVLYLLLSGRRPHPFPSESLADTEEVACETEPEKPSLAAARDLDRRQALAWYRKDLEIWRRWTGRRESGGIQQSRIAEATRNIGRCTSQ